MIERLRGRLLKFTVDKIDRAIAALTNTRARLAQIDLGAVEVIRPPRDEMRQKIQLLVRLRYGVDLMVPAVLLLLAAEGMRLVSPSRGYGSTADYLLSLWPNWTLACVGLAINTAYRFRIRRGGDVRPVAYAQVWLDILLFALMIYTTGGISSPFAFLFTVPVLAASLLLSFRASLAAAATSTFIMAIMALLQYRHIIPSERYFEPLLPLTEKGGFIIAMVTLNGVLYFLIAVASGALSRTVHKYEQDLAHRANEATMLYEVSSSLQSATHLDEVLTQIMDILVRRLNIDHALMYLVNDAGDALDLKLERFHPRLRNPPYGRQKVHMDMKREAGLTAICAIEKRAFNVTDPLNHPLINRELAQRLGVNPFAVAPMLARGRVVGVVGIDRRFQQGIITQEEAQMLGVAGNQAGLTIQNAALYEKYAAASPPESAEPASTV